MQATPTYDFLIVGQGLAGSLLGYFLEQAGKSCYFIDHPEQTASTEVAAGIINPITGRYFVKSWRVDDLLPFAQRVYAGLEAELGHTFYHPRGLLRVLAHQGDENDWLARTGDPAYQPYMAERADPGNYPEHTSPVYGYGETKHSAQVDLPLLIKALRLRWQQQGRWTAAAFDHRLLEITPDGVRYPTLSARNVVFCEGWRMRDNPFFSYLPLQGNKGQVLIVDFPGLVFNKMIKNKVFVAPLPDGTYWVGGTSENRFLDDAPTPEGLAFLTEKLAELMRAPWAQLDHRSAVRPTVRDRRPLLGRHPQHRSLAVFNGLGTKGASLGPFWAWQMAIHLINDSPLDAEVDIARFSPVAG